MANWDQIKAGIFAGESGGDYNTLFGFSNRPGGPFANTRLTDMTINDAIHFSDPSGPYAQYVKGKIGRVATPMGAYQVVGSTLRAAKQAMGFSGNERLTPETQDRIGQHILATQGTGAWEGYKGPRQPTLSPAAQDFVKNNPQPGGFGAGVPDPNNPAVFGSMSPGGSAPNNGIPLGVANYASSEDPKGGNLLQKLGAAFSAAAPDNPAPHIAAMPSPSGANDLMKLLQNPQALAQMMLQKRLA